jgi:hypothetical protein
VNTTWYSRSTTQNLMHIILGVDQTTSRGSSEELIPKTIFVVLTDHCGMHDLD